MTSSSMSIILSKKNNVVSVPLCNIQLLDQSKINAFISNVVKLRKNNFKSFKSYIEKFIQVYNTNQVKDNEDLTFKFVEGRDEDGICQISYSTVKPEKNDPDRTISSNYILYYYLKTKNATINNIFAATTSEAWKVLRPYADYSFPIKILERVGSPDKIIKTEGYLISENYTKRILRSPSTELLLELPYLVENLICEIDTETDCGAELFDLLKRVAVLPHDLTIDTEYEDDSDYSLDGSGESYEFSRKHDSSSDSDSSVSSYSSDGFFSVSRKRSKHKRSFRIKITRAGSITIQQRLEVRDYSKVIQLFNKYLIDTTPIIKKFNFLQCFKISQEKKNALDDAVINDLFKKFKFQKSLHDYGERENHKDFLLSGRYEIQIPGIKKCENIGSAAPRIHQILEVINTNDAETFSKRMKKGKLRFSYQNQVVRIIDYIEAIIFCNGENYFNVNKLWYQIENPRYSETQKRKISITSSSTTTGIQSHINKFQSRILDRTEKSPDPFFYIHLLDQLKLNLTTNAVKLQKNNFQSFKIYADKLIEVCNKIEKSTYKFIKDPKEDDICDEFVKTIIYNVVKLEDYDPDLTMCPNQIVFFFLKTENAAMNNIFVLTTCEIREIVRPYIDYSFPIKIIKRVSSHENIVKVERHYIFESSMKEILLHPLPDNLHKISSLFCLIDSLVCEIDKEKKQSVELFNFLNKTTDDNYNSKSEKSSNDSENYQDEYSLPPRKKIKCKKSFHTQISTSGSLKIERRLKVRDYLGIIKLFNQYLSVEKPTDENFNFLYIFKIPRALEDMLDDALIRDIFDKLKSKQPQYVSVQRECCENFLLPNEYEKTIFDINRLENFRLAPSYIDQIIKKINKNDDETFKTEMKIPRELKFKYQNQKKDYRIIDYIEGGLSYNHQCYFKIDKTWYQTGDDYLRLLNQYFGKIFNKVLIRQGEEGSLSKSENYQLCLVDQLVTCDIFNYTKNSIYLYYVKEKFGQDIRSVSSQILNSAIHIHKALKIIEDQEDKFIKYLWNKASESLKSEESDYKTYQSFVNMLRHRDVVFVYAYRTPHGSNQMTVDHNTEKTESILPQSILAKIEIVRLEETLSKFQYRFKLGICTIPV